MIDSQLSALSVEDTKKLVLWLAMPEMEILKKVVSHMGKAVEVELVNEVVQARDDNSKLELANAKLILAQRYKTFLEVMHEVTNRKQPFAIVKLS